MVLLMMSHLVVKMQFLLLSLPFKHWVSCYYSVDFLSLNALEKYFLTVITRYTAILSKVIFLLLFCIHLLRNECCLCLSAFLVQLGTNTAKTHTGLNEYFTMKCGNCFSLVTNSAKSISALWWLPLL